MSALSKALAQLRNGGMVILFDDMDHESKGDLVLAAEFCTPETIEFMVRHARGPIGLALAGEQADRVGLQPSVTTDCGQQVTASTVSTEARDRTKSEISAHNVATAIKAAIDPSAVPAHIDSAAQIFFLRATDGGVLARSDHTEGAVDLMRLAGLNPAGAICEITRDDGHVARGSEIENFARLHHMPILPIKDIIAHRIANEPLIDEVARSPMPTIYSPQPLEVRAFRSRLDGTEHLALIREPLAGAPLVRVHSECLTGDALGSLRCDCGPQLQEALRQISTGSGGALIYLRGQEGRGIGLANKIRAYALQDQGYDTVEANTALGFVPDARDYSTAAHILLDLGINRIRLLTNNPEKAQALTQMGIEVAERLPLQIPANPHNERYLATKRDKLFHTFPSWN